MDDKNLTEIGEQIVKQKRPKKSEQMQVQTEPGDNTKSLAHTLEINNLPEIDTSDPKQITARIGEYFALCVKNDMRPSVAAMALSLGVDRKTLWTWANGEGRGKNSDVRNSVKRAYAALNVMMEDYMQTGKINPVSGIFLMKNNFGYTDKQEVVLTPNNPLGDQTTNEELEQRYLESVADENLTD